MCFIPPRPCKHSTWHQYLAEPLMGCATGGNLSVQRLATVSTTLVQVSFRNRRSLLLYLRAEMATIVAVRAERIAHRGRPAARIL